MPDRSEAAFTWLHLSDLHIGQPRSQALWTSVEDRFFRDLDAELKRLGTPVDLLLLTGDLAYKGDAGEYDALDQFLERLLARLPQPKPLLFAVPGNHDFARPAKVRDFAAIDRLDDADDEHGHELRQTLFHDRDASLLERPFAAYQAWRARRILPALAARGCPHHLSYFPGELSAVAEKDGFRLGLVGLNTAWSQYSGKSFDGHLRLDVEQLHAALPSAPRGSPLDFFPRRGAQSVHHALLLQHHPPSWLSQAGQRVYREAIFTPDRFSLLLFGHMHAARTVGTAISGGAPRYELQAPSLFGVEHYGTSQEERAFGYMLGRIGRRGEIVVRPRRVVKRGGGELAFDVDQDFTVRKDGWVLIRSADEPEPEPAEAPAPQPAHAPPPSPRPSASALDDATLSRLRAWSLEKHAKLTLIGVGAGNYPFGIDDIYVPLHARAVGDRFELHGAGAVRGRGTIEDVILVEQAFQRSDGRDLSLLGEAGAGKTTALKKLLHQVWTHGPESVGLAAGTVPLLLRLRRLTASLLDEPVPLLALLGRELSENSGGIFGAEVAERLWSHGRLLLLLDGLDEIADPALRARACAVIVGTLPARHVDGLRAVVTSRPDGYDRDVQHGGALFDLELAQLRLPQIRAMAERWFVAARTRLPSAAAGGEDARARAAQDAQSLVDKLGDSTQVDPLLRGMIATPLFLTLLCVVALRRGELPPRRVDFFRDCLEILLGSWPRERGDRVPWTHTDALSVLGPLALQLQRAQTRDEGERALVARIRDEVDRLSAKLHAAPDSVTAERFLRWAQQAAGVLADAGDGRLGFAHRGLQEYLAALEIGTTNRAAELAAVFGDEWWRDTILLAVALPEHRVFEPLMAAVAAGDALPREESLLIQAVREAHRVSSAPFAAVLDDDRAPSLKRVAILRALLSRPDPELLLRAARLVTHPDEALSSQAARLLQQERRRAPAPPADAPASVFIAAAPRERALAQKIARTLRSAGARAWCDAPEAGAPPLEEALREATRVVLVLGRGGLGAWDAGGWQAIARHLAACRVPVIAALLAGAAGGEVIARFVDEVTAVQLAAGGRDLAPLFEAVGLAGVGAVPGAAVEEGHSFVEPVSGIRFLWVPGGTFEMGAADITDDEKPVHAVTVPSYWLAETPVTNAQYAAFAQATGRAAAWSATQREFGGAEQPVAGVTWTEASEYCAWLSKASGMDVRLPTEAQWERAARGSDGRPYPWGSEPPDDTRARFGRPDGATAEVGAHPAGRGPYGHLDLAGNVWEWCRDVWDERVYVARARSRVPAVDPEVTVGDTSIRVLRGGGFWSDAGWLRAAYRNWNHAEYRVWYIGFRLAAFPASTRRVDA